MAEKKTVSKVLTPEFRVSFPNVFTPRAFEGQEAKYSIVMLFPKGTDLSGLRKLAQQAVNEKWPDATKRPKNMRNPFRDGDVEKSDMDGYAGHIFISASSKMAPGIVDKNRNAIIDEAEFYPGCYAHATVTCYAYSKMGNSGVAFGLQNIQKLRDGQPFSMRSKPEDDFQVIADGEFNSTASAPQGDDMFA